MTFKPTSAFTRNQSFLSRRVPERVKNSTAARPELTTVRPSSVAAEGAAKRDGAKAIKAKYTISDNEMYDALYLKVRKLFLESL